MEKLKVAAVVGVVILVYCLAWWLDRKARRDPIQSTEPRWRVPHDCEGCGPSDDVP